MCFRRVVVCGKLERTSHSLVGLCAVNSYLANSSLNTTCVCGFYHTNQVFVLKLRTKATTKRHKSCTHTQYIYMRETIVYCQIVINFSWRYYVALTLMMWCEPQPPPPITYIVETKQAHCVCGLAETSSLTLSHTQLARHTIRKWCVCAPKAAHIYSSSHNDETNTAPRADTKLGYIIKARQPAQTQLAACFRTVSE